MTTLSNENPRVTLRRIARRAMIQHGLTPDFPPEALAELEAIDEAPAETGGRVRDLRALPWCSIDNEESRDLDQLTVGEALADGTARILIAIADVDVLVPQNSALDVRAQRNTTSVYTPAEIFPMLPERLSTDLTSMNPDVDRMAVVMEMTVCPDGALDGSDVYRALVRNHAKLAYDAVAAWLDGAGPMPAPMAGAAGLEENLRLQDRVAHTLKAIRHQNGALDLETVDARVVFEGDDLKGVETRTRNRAKTVIEDFMIAANGISARYLADRGFPSLRRVVRTPKRWERLAALAAEHGFTLPPEPDSPALEEFLRTTKVADPARFLEVSLSVVKLLGPGEYVVQPAGGESLGHFGLAVRDYTHSTAPNRRYPDLVTQRLLKAAIAGRAVPYTVEELETLATHCTRSEDAARKVERQVQKAATAMLLQSRLGEQFDAIVTGASAKGSWVRIARPPVEGRLVSGATGADVGDAIRVTLVAVDVEQGFIDFERSRG